MEFSAQNVESIVAVFYQNEAPQQAQAHEWLTQAQNSAEAWQFVWLLLDPTKPAQTQFFAATTLHTKLLKYWHEVPTEQYEVLKTRLLDTIVTYANGPKIVLNRLCIALSAYIIHTVASNWENAFEELVSSFQPQHLPHVEPERVIWILLEILTVIPEEFQSTTISMGQRSRVKGVLQNASRDILKVVQMCMTPLPMQGFEITNIMTYLYASKCATAWIQLGGTSIEDCAQIISLAIDLIPFVYWNKSDPEMLSNDELELIEANIELLTVVIQQPQTMRCQNNVTKLMMELLQKFGKMLEHERIQPEPSKEIMSHLYGLLITSADIHCKLIVDNLASCVDDTRQATLDYLRAILMCTDLPGYYPIDETSSSLSFGFWFSLQDDITALEANQSAKLMQVIKPLYSDLTCIMLRKSMHPLSNNRWSADDKEVFRCYRQDIADTYLYCYNVLQLEMLEILDRKLMEALGPCVNGANANNARTSNECTANTNGGEPRSSIKWNEVETCLHAYSSVAGSIDFENYYIPKLMTVIKAIPYQQLHVKVLASALETIGAYSDWLVDNPHMLDHALFIVVASIDNVEVATTATLALKDITHSCQKFMKPYAEHILVAAQGILQGGHLKLAECNRIMYSVGKVLSVMPVNLIMNYLNVLLVPGFEEMQRLVIQEPSEAVRTCLVTRLKVVSSLFNSLSVSKEDLQSQGCANQPTVVIMQNTMSLFNTIGDKFHDSPEVIDELSQLFKCVVTSLMDDCAPLVRDIFKVCLDIYRKRPQGSVLVVSTTLTILFASLNQHSDEHQIIPMASHFLYEMVQTTLQMCADLSSQNALTSKTDVIESFFNSLYQIRRKVPLSFMAGIDMGALFQCAVLCLSLPELQTLKVCISFLNHFINLSRETGDSNVVLTYGESLVQQILLTIGTSLIRPSIALFSDLLMTLNRKYCDSLSVWLHSQLARDNFPSPRLTPAIKLAFTKAVLREKTNKKKVYEATEEFAFICLGILKEDDAAR